MKRLNGDFFCVLRFYGTRCFSYALRGDDF